MYALFNRFELQMTLTQALSCSHAGKCDDDVTELLKNPAIKRQIKKLDADDVRAELKEYGAWSNEELSDADANAARLVWIAAGNIAEEHATRARGK